LRIVSCLNKRIIIIIIIIIAPSQTIGQTVVNVAGEAARNLRP